jgi:hypothetical protein
MIDAAVAVATGKGNLSCPSQTLELLRQGDQNLAAAFRTELTRQAAATLLMLDRSVIDVYQENTWVPEPSDHSELEQPIRLWVVALHRTPSLYASIDRLNAALVEEYATVCSTPPLSLLMTIVVDERDGYLLRGSDFWNGEAPVLLASRRTDSQLLTENGASR